MGGLAAQVSGGDFATGAAAAGANEALVAKLDQAFKSLSLRTVKPWSLWGRNWLVFWLRRYAILM